MIKFLCCLAVSLFTATALFSQANFFERLQAHELPDDRGEVLALFKKTNVMRLDEAGFRQYLSAAPLEFHTDGAAPIQLEIPLPNGETELFGIVESPILSPEIAAQHPEIKTYCGNGIRHKEAIIRINLTSEGFDAILLNVAGDAVYFQKMKGGQLDLYFNYFTKDVVAPKNKATRPTCGVGLKDGDAHFPIKVTIPAGVQERNNSGGTLRTYKLAMAANGEFTAEHGGTQAGAFATITNYVNRLNILFRRELSVHLNLVSGTNLTYVNAASDPYTNNNQGAMLNENQSNCDAVIGNGNYDVAHVWGYVGGSGGGVASFESVCWDPYKGQGVSGEGDLNSYAQVFMDQLLFHEIGHQFGMSHSYNSIIPVCETRNGPTSVEPGAGTTIMSYGFTCGSDDYFDIGSPKTGPILQFHTASYAQAEANIANTMNGYGGSCVVNTATGNTPPVVTMPSTVTIPKSTPFALTGSATDANGDGLTYCWEGIDIGAGIPTAGTLADLSQPPFFRSYGHVDSSGPTRYFPLLEKILDGTNYAIGDKLPSVSITTNHRLTVRDNNAAGGGVTYGAVAVTVNGAIGPFLVTSNLAGSYPGLSQQAVTWSVNGTDAATPNVKISLSTNGGLTFPTVLVASTANDGATAVTLPPVLTSQARIKVEAVGNVFFDISNSNFSISSPLPIELVGFWAKAKGARTAALAWETSAETNNRGFEIEVSSDGGEFQTVGFVAGHGTTATTNKYQFDVPGLEPGHYFFRLKIVDLDGRGEYSNVQQLLMTAEGGSILVFPNPSFDGVVQFETSNIKGDEIRVEMSNAAGQVLGTQLFQNDGRKIGLQMPGAGVFNLKFKLENGTLINKRVVSFN